jgi:two-component system, cell cycle sensor histidine kinase and response regulator CckA
MMNRHPYESPQEKRLFVSWLVGVMLLLNSFVIGLALFTAHQSREQYLERAEAQAQNLAQALVHSMAGNIDAADVGLLSVVDEAERETSAGGVDRITINAFITKQHRRLPELDTLRMTNARGELIYGSDLVPQVVKSVADREYFKKLHDDPAPGLVISHPMIGRISGKWSLVVARRYNNPDGSFAGVVSGLISLQRIRALLSSINVGAHGGISLRDGEMRVIIREPEHTGNGNPAGSQAIYSSIERLLTTGQRSGTFYTPVSFDNLAKVISFRNVDNHPLNVVVALAEVDYLAPWRRDLWRVGALAALFVGATMILSRLVYVRWRREKGAEAQLRQTAHELERRVAERTGELFLANSQLLMELAERNCAEEKLREGRNMLAKVIDAIPQAVFWKDRDSVYLGCNVVFARYAGVADPEQIVGKSDFDLPWLPEESMDYRRDDREVMQGNLPKHHIVERQKVAGGGQIWVDTTKIPLCSETGEVYGVLGVYDNITERKAIEEARDKALALVESLLASSPMGIQVFDGESGDCIIANQPIADLVGGKIDELLAQNFRGIPSWQPSGVRESAEEVLRDGATRHLEGAFRTSFGRGVNIDCFLSRFHVEGRAHLLCIVVDIEQRKRLEEEHRQIEAQMLHVQKLESLGVLAGGIAHDFNNILMVVIGNTDLAMMRIGPDSPARENLRQIEHAANRASDLARQMLAYSGKGRFVIENLDLHRIVEEMAQMLEVSVSKKVSLQYRCQPGLSCISGDATQLRQVLLNLVINASEAIGDETGSISIATSSRVCDREYLSGSWIDDHLAEGIYIVLEVADTGCGIDPEVLPKIFDPFFTTKFTGRGLGMAAVLGIVRGHRGAISIRSVKGEGTVFTLLFPAVSAASDCGSRGGEPAAAGITRGSGTILLVDDEERIRTLAQEMLQALGYRVLLACNGREAVEVYAEHRGEIGCVLLDLTMPEMDGEQTFVALRCLDPGVRVVISSGYNEQEVSRKFAGKGAPGFIQKPYKLVDVSNKLREIFS